MVQQAQDGLARAGDYVGPGLRAVDDVAGMADGCIQPPYIGRDVPGTGFGCQHSLSRGEDQRTVGRNVFCRAGLYRLDSFRRAGDLPHHILVDRVQLRCLCKHPFQVRG